MCNLEMLQLNVKMAKSKAKLATSKAQMDEDRLNKFLLEQSTPASLQQEGTEDYHILSSSPVAEPSDVTENIIDKMLFALGMDEDDKLSLTIFEKDKGATISLNKVFAEYFVKEINHYIQLMT